MTPKIGATVPFEATSSQWSSYCERLTECFIANGITDRRKKVAVLLSVVGGPTYDPLRDLFAPEKPNTKTFNELVTKLRGYLEPKPTVIAETYKLYQRQQKPDKTISEYMAALRRLAAICQFNDFFEQALRPFCLWLTDEKIKMQLLQEKGKESAAKQLRWK
uniref:Retrotransposon gag domain-containing protein n=1 Tax=Amphimedon queenslandica TaxID=400682 RepID=A0A1X7UU53_AMPQE